MSRWRKEIYRYHLILDCSCGSRTCKIESNDLQRIYDFCNPGSVARREHTFALNILALFALFERTYGRYSSNPDIEGKYILVRCGNGHPYPLYWGRRMTNLVEKLKTE